MRALKRQIAKAIYRALVADAHRRIVGSQLSRTHSANVRVVGAT